MSVFIEILVALVFAAVAIGIAAIAGTFATVFARNLWTEHRKSQRRH